MKHNSRTGAKVLAMQGLAWLRDVWRILLHRGPSQFQFWMIALLIGISAGFAALLFRKGITALQAWIYGAEDIHFLHSFAQDLPWYMLLVIPTVGGLVVGIILHNFTPDGRVRSVADVIEGAAMRNGRVEIRAGLGSAMASFLTLSTGGSAGREGPVVHLAGVISSWVSDRIKADGITGRDLLGCAVAAAVSASFNAPIAGALFALEVVLRHFAVHAFAPIAIASVAGTVINRLEYGDVTEFTLTTPGALQFYVELPAFLMLGLICGLVAVVLMRSIFWADRVGTDIQTALSIPRWLRPAVSGFLLGAIAIWFPHIIGVGYETTVLALTGGLVLSQAILFTVVKTAAVAITMGGRMGGGVFSPSLMIGAMTGLSFGLIATSVLPEVSGTHTLYAFAGMGAVAAAVLGAPISTTLIVFELTGDWQIGLAVMVSVSLSTALASRLVDRSFFLTQLERRNLHCAAGPQAYLLALLQVGGLMRPLGDPRCATPEDCAPLIDQGLMLRPDQSLEAVLPVFDRADVPFLPVVAPDDVPAPSDAEQQGRLLGVLYHVDALKAYNRALVATAAEEHS
ncbi:MULTISPECIES: chloride channel protein [Rhodobacterales]|jgi:CIC family chloride channel protein|uniref:chloride channel protein n=1 Tax=Rhodobacterales TaxID=204455 RepID=UPI00237F3DB2|nr:chloride channel protein [Phaeobacter gallaeciensis]MDE4095877.1 chloride channel protein [Phaeobacter gallaeciensis]MDE4104688.1 chloride channel protein [Phaeobacter gallaeciensis]MDE4109145.1 chloride channel protein [Phaeobacter gallaeciensis]MDE4113612.1 chloride channel protein [Phaeobacter gallaeciensis]MDE4118080.1 chloride channel protein [Phaeobacter gallaeciensis]